jgi:hypothetical protein
MAWRSTSRHARPQGRGALKAAYADLLSEMSEVRRHRYADTLENTRLTALVDALTVQVSRLQGELTVARVELQQARTAPVQRDPSIAVLAAEAAELRAAVVGQQTVLESLSVRLAELLDRDLAREAAARAAAAVAVTPVALPLPLPLPQPVEVAAPAQDEPVRSQPEVEAPAAAVIHIAGPIEAAVAPLPPADAEPDDLALLRLRLVRAQAAAAAVEPEVAVPSSATP